jgi:hypothetical protein
VNGMRLDGGAAHGVVYVLVRLDGCCRSAAKSAIHAAFA